MSRTSRHTPGGVGPEWRLSHRAPRTDWSDTVESCAACGAPVDMRGEHYQVFLDRDVDRPGKLSIERRRLVFCDESCADEWLEAA